MMLYQTPKPKPSIVIYFLAVMVVVGLVAMFLAARYAFGQVMGNDAQAFAAALLIEASMIVEAITIVRARAWKANIPALIGLVVSILVSGTYNYVQVQHAGKAAGIVDTWQLTSLALGPLSALVFLAMAVGRELRSYEEAVSTWENERQDWQKKHDADERERLLALEIERRHAQEVVRQARIAAELEAERIKAEAARVQLEMQIKAQERQAALEARQAVKLAKIAAHGGAKGDDILTPRNDTLEGDGQTVTGGDTRSTADLVLEYFSRYPDGTVTGAAKHAGRSRTAASKALHKLEAEGRIHRNGQVVVLSE